MKSVSLVLFGLVAALSLSTSAHAETVYLNLGDSIQIGGKTVSCGGSAPVTHDWFCSVIPTGGYKDMYSGRASTRQQAHDQALTSCYSGLGGHFSNCDNVQCEESGQTQYYCSVLPSGGYTQTYSGSGDTKLEAHDTALTSCYAGLGGVFSNCQQVTCSSSD